MLLGTSLMTTDPVTVERPKHPLHALTTYELKDYRRQLENAITYFDQQEPVPAVRASLQAALDGVLADLADRNPAPGHEPTLAGFKQKVAGFKAAFPDLVEDLQDIIASGDTAATRWVVTGSLQQDFMGIPASGQAIRVEGMNFYRLKDGRVTDIWTQFDGVALMQQLGAIRP